MQIMTHALQVLASLGILMQQKTTSWKVIVTLILQKVTRYLQVRTGKYQQ